MRPSNVYAKLPSRAVRLAAATLAIAALAGAERLEAQQYDVTGVVADSAGAGVGGAMVVALAMPDSALAEWATTGGDGAFTLRVTPGEYVLQVTLLGHRTVRRPLSVVGADVAVGRIGLEVLAVEVDPLVVSVEHVPFLNRRDTLSFNALAFEVRPNATVEDLLRRLPGIQVEADGSITAQGEQVRNVLVDGKEFFGSDPTVATRNLPADAVERVDVYDKESDTAEFTGIPDGQEERTINLGLREEARHGYFGDLAGGLGSEAGGTEAFDAPAGFDGAPEDRLPYDGRVNVNRFSPATQLAAIGSAGNVGRPGFRGRSAGPTPTEGFFENLLLGLNASHDFGEETWIRSSYFFGRTENQESGTLDEERLLGSEVASTIQGVDESRSENFSHRIDLNSQLEFAEGHELRLRSDIEVASSQATSSSMQTQTVDGAPLNSATTDRFSDRDEVQVDGRLTWRKRLGDSGRSLVAEARVDYSDSDRLTELASIVDAADPAPEEDILQEQESIGQTLSHSFRLSLTEPIGERDVLELFGERSAVDEDDAKSFFDLDDGTPVFNPILSSAFDRTYAYLRGGVRFSRNGEDSRFVAGVEIQDSDLQGRVLDSETAVDPISTGFTHLLPEAELRLELSEGRNLRLRYNTSTREPSLTQFQPFADNDDPLNVYVGNPDLQPEYRHRLRGEYRLFDQFSFVNLFTFASLSLVNDNISTSRAVDATGRQVRMPMNTGRALGANAGVNFGTPIRPVGLRLELDYRLGYTLESAFVNDVENESRIWQHTVGASLENRAKERVDVRVGGTLSYNDVDYSLNRELDRSYINPRLFADASLYLGSWTLATEASFQGYDQDVFGPDLDVTMWQASITRLVMGDRAEIQLAAYDLLDQNKGVSVTNTSSFNRIERVQSLGRHVMLRFNYHLGSQSRQGRGGRRGRGGRGRR